MKLADILRMNDECEPNEISILLSDIALGCCRLNLVQESIWFDSGYKDWKYRIDPEDPRIPQKRHVHIARNKHTASKKTQASWNNDGTRHDKKSFNLDVGSIGRVREIARNVLGIPSGITLESHPEYTSPPCLIEDISLSVDGKIGYVFLHL